MSGVFLNYRTGDGDWAATLLKRELSTWVDNVFLAGSSIRPGEDFTQRITEWLPRCEVLLAIIGSRWLTATDHQGRRKIDDPEDWVRREIIEAYRHDLRVIPVLLDGVDRLAQADLPEDIAGLANLQYLRLHHRNYKHDIARLREELTDLVPPLAAAWNEYLRNGGGPPGERRAVVNECPYPGLAAFGPEQTQWFFGRDRLIAELTIRLDEHLRKDGPMMVVAPSGAGKSSLLRAGLVPKLAASALPGSREWPCVVFTPTAHPMAALATHLTTGLDATPDRVADADETYTRLVTAGNTALSTPLSGHTNAVYSVAFSPDGHTLASASKDRSIRLWNVSDPARPTSLGQPLTGHTNTIYSVAFSPDGHTLASASFDRSVRLWGMNVDQAIQRICAVTRNILTPKEWQRYVGNDLPYNPPCE